jgi:hypothetical protein
MKNTRDLEYTQFGINPFGNFDYGSENLIMELN